MPPDFTKSFQMQNVRLLELFAQQVHISRLQNILKESTSRDKQLEILRELKASGSPANYQYKVLDHLTRHINNSTALEVTDDLSEEHAQALIACMDTSGRHTSADLGTATPVIYRFENHEVKIVEERDTLAKAGGTGYRTWEAALALGDFLIRNPLSQKRILELGAGTGFVSRVLVELGYDVLATDGDPVIVDRLEKLNAQNLWWVAENNQALNEFIEALPFDNYAIVAADVLYDPNNYPPFLYTVSKLLKTKAKYALVATTMRQEATYALLDPECEKLGLTVEWVASYNEDGGDISNYFYMNNEHVEIIKLSIR